MKTGRSRLDLGSTWMLAALPLAGFLLFPIVALVARGTLPAALAQLRQPDAALAVRLSLVTTLCATLLTITFGVPLAFWLSRGGGIFRRLVSALCELPVVLPPAAAGVALLIAFGRAGFLNLSVSFTSVAVVMAQVFVSAPFFLRAATSAFADQPSQMFEIAKSDGASSWRMLTRIALPVGTRSLIAGAAIAWARAAGEFGATIIFAGNYPGTTQTMPLAIYLGFESNLDEALALSVLLLGVGVVALVIVALLVRSGGREAE